MPVRLKEMMGMMMRNENKGSGPGLKIRYHSGICLVRLRKTSVRVTSLSTARPFLCGLEICDASHYSNSAGWNNLLFVSE